MDSALERLVRSNIVDFDAAIEKAEDKESFRKAFAPGADGAENP
jgi:hypothetical protein